MGKPRYQRCFLQQAFTQETPVIEGFCDKPLIGNQMRFVLLSKGAQLVLCDVNVYGGNNVLFSLSLWYTFDNEDLSERLFAFEKNEFIISFRI